MRNTKLPNPKCPACSTVMEGAVDPTGNEVAKPGAISLCFSCGHLMAFTETMGLRDLNDEEMLAIAGDPDLIKLQKVRVKMKAMQQQEEAQKNKS